MLVKFPHSCLFGTCKAPSLAAPCKNSCVKIFRRIGSASSKRANFLQEKAKAQLIVVYLLTSILTHYCGKFAFLNRTATGYFMPRKSPRFWFFCLTKEHRPPMLIVTDLKASAFCTHCLSLHNGIISKNAAALRAFLSFWFFWHQKNTTPLP